MSSVDMNYGRRKIEDQNEGSTEERRWIARLGRWVIKFQLDICIPVLSDKSGHEISLRKVSFNLEEFG